MSGYDAAGGIDWYAHYMVRKDLRLDEESFQRQLSLDMPYRDLVRRHAGNRKRLLECGCGPARTALSLAHLDIHKAYTSPLKRCTETLDILIERLGLSHIPYISHDALKERDYGVFTGKNKWQVKEEVLWNIKLLRMKFPNMFLLLDKATWNKNKMVIGYLDNNNIPYMFLPTGASDMNATEECWRQTRKDITSNISCNNKEELFGHLESYWRRQPFKHNLLNYLDY